MRAETSSRKDRLFFKDSSERPPRTNRFMKVTFSRLVLRLLILRTTVWGVPSESTAVSMIPVGRAKQSDRAIPWDRQTALQVSSAL